MAFQEKRIKIKILQQKANDFNERYDQLEEQGLDLDEIPKIIKSEHEDFKAKTIKTKTIPYDQGQQVISIGNNMTLGFEDTHKINPTTKQMMFLADQKLQKYKKGEIDEETKNLGKTQHEQDAKMKKEIYKDHINDLFDAKNLQMKNQSQYQENYVFNMDMQEQCDTTNFDHHMRKNDLKWYSEAFARSKGTMRK